MTRSSVIRVIVWGSIACASVLVAAPESPAVLVAHYTFDDGDFSGSGTAGAPWVAHDLAAPATNATATGTNGGSNILPSQPGVFGQAFQFTEDSNIDSQDLSTAENLLTAPTGTVPTGSAPRTFALWFNSASDLDQNKLFGYGTSTADRTFEVGLEVGGIRLRTFGGNIAYGQDQFDFEGVDAGWHHLTVRHDGSSTFAGVDVFINGVQLPVGFVGGDALNDSINTSNSQIGIGTGGVLGSGLSQGFTGLLDEFRIYDNALSNSEIQSLAVAPLLELSLEVNTTTGRVSIKNDSAQDFEIDFYQIGSTDDEGDGGSLLTNNWNSLQNQDLAGFPAGDGTGNGWEEGGFSSSKLLGEAVLGSIGPPAGDYNDDGLVNTADYTDWRDNLGTPANLPNDLTPDDVSTDDYEVWRNNYGATGGNEISSSTFASGMQPIDLGLLFATSDSQDLKFTYRLSNGSFVDGNVFYVQAAAIATPEPFAATLLSLGVAGLVSIPRSQRDETLRQPARSRVPIIHE